MTDILAPAAETTSNALQALIREHMTNTGDTIADIAARGGLARQTVSGILARNGTGGIPRRETIAGLAVGLGLSRAVVADAAAQAAAMHTDAGPNDHRVTVLCELAKQLPPAHVDVLLVAARALARANADAADAP